MARDCGDPTDFDAHIRAIAGMAVPGDRLEPLAAHASHLAASTSKFKFDAELLAACTAVRARLSNLPAIDRNDPQAVHQMQTLMQGYLDLVTRFTQRNGDCAQNSTPLWIGLYVDIVRQHELLAHEGPTTKLLDGLFGPQNAAKDVEFACVVLPKLVTRLQESRAADNTRPQQADGTDRAHAAGLLGQIAGRMTGQYGLKKVDPDTKQWSIPPDRLFLQCLPTLTEGIRTVMTEQGIGAGDNAELKRGLADLDKELCSQPGWVSCMSGIDGTGNEENKATVTESLNGVARQMLGELGLAQMAPLPRATNVQHLTQGMRAAIGKHSLNDAGLRQNLGRLDEQLCQAPGWLAPSNAPREDAIKTVTQIARQMLRDDGLKTMTPENRAVNLRNLISGIEAVIEQYAIGAEEDLVTRDLPQLKEMLDDGGQPGKA